MEERTGPIGALTVDVEEYYHATIFSKTVARKEWDDRAGRAARSVERLLERFDRWHVRATFFVLGWYAERNRALVRSIADAGHEIASHGWDHTRIFDQKPESFRDDVRRTRSLLEDISGLPVHGYRAPTFSITERTLWAIPILAEEGHRFDSSIFPIRHDRYGIPRFPTRPVRLRFDGGELIEFPLTTLRVGWWNLPIAGGGYIRQFPLSWIERGFRKIRKSGEPVVLYLHPWEIDPDQPRLPLPPAGRIRHYRGIDRMEERLGRLVSDGSFGTMSESLRSIDIGDYFLPTV